VSGDGGRARAFIRAVGVCPGVPEGGNLYYLLGLWDGRLVLWTGVSVCVPDLLVYCVCCFEDDLSPAAALGFVFS
jgi:hypothetical protein